MSVPEAVLEDVAGQIEAQPSQDYQHDALMDAIAKLAQEYDLDREALEITTGELAILAFGPVNGIKTRNMVTAALERLSLIHI